MGFLSLLGSLFRGKAAAQPESAAACFERGTQLAQGGQLDQAVALLERAVQLDPNHAGAYYNLGSALRDRGEPEAALAAYREVARLAPGFAEAHYAIGIVHLDARRYAEALEALRRALEIEPRHAEAPLQAGNAHMGLGDWRAALAAFEAAIAARPDYVEARWAHTMSQLPAVYDAGVDPAERRRAFAAQLDALRAWLAAAPRPEAYRAVGVHQPFYLAYQEEPNRELLARYGALSTGLMSAWQSHAGLAAPQRAAHDGPRVGIVSAHVCDHSVWNALASGWVEDLADAGVDLQIFHLGSADDAETAIARRQAGEFHEGRRSFEEWAHRLHAAALDVVIYPEVGMDATTAKLAALRLAPVQAASWGHPETTGLPTIDYYLSAQGLEPAGAQANYTEKLLALPNLGCRLAAPVTRADASFIAGFEPRADEIVLLCPGTSFKYAPQHDALLAEIAQRVPRARLVFFRGSPAPLADRLRERLRESFRRAGLDFDRRALFIPWQSGAGFRALLERADLFLDTIGFSGFNTALQAVEGGLPIVTREGRFLRGRLASGILRRIGLDELVAPDERAYVELAVALANDAPRRGALKARIQAGRARLYDDAAPGAALLEFLGRL